MRKWIRPAFGLMVLAAALSMALHGAWGQSGKPITFAATFPLTGPFADHGKQSLAAVQVWEAKINAEGGLLGRPVQIVHIDNKSDPNTAVSAFRKFIAEGRDITFGTYAAPIVEQESTVAEQERRLYVQSGGYPLALFGRGYKYLFFASRGTSVDLPGPILSFIDALPADQKPRKISSAAVDSIAFQDLEKHLGPGLKQRATDYSNENYPLGIRDAQPIVQKWKAASPDAVLVHGYAPDTVLFVRAIRLAGLKPKLLIITPTAASLETFPRDVGAPAEGVIYYNFWEPTLPFPGVEEFARAFKKKMGVAPLFSAGNAYASMQIYEQAIKATRSLDQDRLRDQVRTGTFQTVIGTLAYEERGLPRERQALLAQWQGGKQVVIWPTAVARGNLLYPYPAQ